MADIWTRIPAGSTPPPPTPLTISSLVLDMTETDGGPYYYSQCYFGDSGAAADTVYTSNASFLTDNPSAALETFASIAPATGAFSFSGNSVTSAVPTDLRVTAAASLPGPSIYAAFDDINNGDITITFSPPVQAVGLNLAYIGGHVTALTAKFYDGATLLSSQVVSLPIAAPLSTATWSFLGFARLQP